MARPKKKRGPNKSKELQIIEKLEAEVIQEGEMVGTVRTEPMLTVAIVEYLRGSSARELKDALEGAGFKCSLAKAYRVMKIAKHEVRKRCSKDFDANLAWAQENLLEMHANAKDMGDYKAQFVIIKELIDLWGLKKPQEAQEELEVTTEMVEQFEAALLR